MARGATVPPRSTLSPMAPALPASLPSSWVARHPTTGDVKAIHALCRACDEAVGVADISLVDVEADVTRPSADPARNQLVVVDGSRVLVWAWLEDHSPGDVRVDLFVDRTLPGATADVLAGWAWQFLLARSGEVTAAHGLAAADVTAGTNDGDAVTEGWLRTHGFARQRTFWRMRRDVDGTEAPAHPPGVVVRQVADTGTGPGSDLRVVHGLHEEAFADHWNFHPRDFDSWWGQMQTSAGFDLSLWWLAEVDGEPAGLLIGAANMAAEGGLYVDTLGTVRAARRRGVARTLLGAAFAEAGRRGLHQVSLNVDSESATGATRLYESAGMRVEFAVHQWQQRLTVG